MLAVLPLPEGADQYRGQAQRGYGGKAHYCKEPKTYILVPKVSGKAGGLNW